MNQTKKNLAIIALEHTKNVEQGYAAEIANSVANTKIYRSSRSFVEHQTQSTRIVFEENDAVSTLILDGNKDNIAVLNFASYTKPGGGFLAGAIAQEESLCHYSDLYNIISRFQKFFSTNKRKENKGLYTNAALYTPNVIFEKDGERRKAAVITCAAPNYFSARKNFGVTAEENKKAFESRVKFLRNILEDNGIKTAILGAWGCGVFGQDPEIVAAVMIKEFARSALEEVIFAVPKGNNAEVFKKAIKQYAKGGN